MLYKFKGYIYQLVRNSLALNSSVLILSSLLSQGINFFCYPFLTRIVPAVSFGEFALLTSYVSIFSIFAFGRLELLIPKFKTSEERIELFQACVLFFVFVLGIIIVCTYFFSGYFFEFSKMEIIRGWLVSVITTFVTTSFLNLINSYQIALGSFSFLGFIRILNPLCLVGFTYLFSSSHDGYMALVYGINGANLLSITLALFNVFHYKKEVWRMSSFERALEIFRANKRMIFINAPHAVIDSFQTNLMNFSIGRFYTIESLGQYSMANRLVKAPMTTISSSISQVFYKEVFNFIDNKESLKRYVYKIFLILVALSLVVSAVIVFFVKFLFFSFFTEAWTEASYLMLVLLPWLVGNFVSSPLSQITILKNKQFEGMFFGFFYNFLTIASLYWCGRSSLGLIPNLLLTSFIALVVNVVFIWWILRVIDE
ncbi:oligosaccharide flippase family protein [Bdellovibrio sp. HCB-162]|uniref:oligosaccharide flippase family protein n=1 Tax=Bdellovibrio sp. HCB-162 TaxID=3394234 RepID=UPI0039BD3B3B